MLGTADHQAVSALGAPDAAARPDVEIVNAASRECCCAANVIFEMSVATVDDGVALLQVFGERCNSMLRRTAGWDHDPHGARRCEPRHEIGNRGGASCAAP